MITLTIDGNEITVEDGSTVLQACEAAGIEIPRFCYHERLTIAGNCRMCLVEQEKAPKPIASCAMPAGEGMVIHTNTETVQKAREGVMEFLLINHPLDCPICDQGGECDLQDQAVAYGKGLSRYREHKRAVDEKYMGPLVKTVMTRCIHCTRCVRFAEEVAGVPELGALGRGEHMEITSYLEKALASELSGNIIDLCPVGALTSKPYAFTARSWELTKTESIDCMDATGSAIRVDTRGNQVMRVLPRLNEAVNEEWISDKTRFAIDGLAFRRLDQPWVRRRKKLRPASWPEAFKAIKKAVKGVSGDALAAIIGDLQDLESMFALKDLFASLGSERLECRQDGAKLDASCRAGYLFNSTIGGIEEADLLLLVGSNPRLEAPVLNARILKATRHFGLKVARIGAPVDLTYGVEELGNEARLLEAILAGKHEFAAALEGASRPMLIMGQGALQRPDGAAILKLAHQIAEKFGLVNEDWNGFNMLHTAASRVGGLDLGLVSEGGVAAILDDAKTGNCKVVFLAGADEIDMSALENAFVIYMGSHGDAGAAVADVILPGAAYTEKSGSWINTEGRVQQGTRASFPPGDAREDWTILRALSEVLGPTLPYDSLIELRTAMEATLDHLEAVGADPSAPWGAFGTAGKIKTGGFTPAIENFWFTNPIARASRTMEDCDAAARGEDVRTGTDG